MSVAELEAEVKEYKLQLETVVSGLQADPDNTELQNLQTELEEFISLTESSIAELKPKSVSAPPPLESPSTEKWSKENHPAFQTGYRRPGDPPVQNTDEKDDQLPVYKVNDTVLAKWKSGDRSFYPAKITSITGSSTKPVYIVTFKGYGNTETVFGHEIRPAQNQQAGQKRKAEEAIGSGSGSTFGTSTGSGISSPAQLPLPGVISAASTVDPVLATAARNGQDQASLKRDTLDGAPKSSKMSKKMSSQKALEGAQSKWQSFQGSKGKYGKGGKKMKGESMFRTGEGMNAKVGFIGSGQAMRKDQARTRHVYDTGKDEDY